jgi:hypothetical protein
MVREVVQEMLIHKVEIPFINKKLGDFLLDLSFIFIHTTMLWSRRKIAPSWVTFLFLLWFQSKLPFQAFQDLLCTSTGTK